MEDDVQWVASDKQDKKNVDITTVFVFRCDGRSPPTPTPTLPIDNSQANP